VSPYGFGTRSAETRALQRALAGLGLYAGELDGIFGHGTEAAVAAARDRFGLGAGGVDAVLLSRLGLAVAPANPIQDFMLRQAAALFLSHLKGLLPMNFLAGYRTYIVAALMLLTGLAGVVGIDIPNFTGQAPGNLVMEALAFFFLRQGLKTGA
jgi:peptidoglycan hydrolase-like protein with peptidoglycan-binding domain